MQPDQPMVSVAKNATSWQLKYAMASVVAVLLVSNVIFPAAVQAQLARPGSVDKTNLTRLPSNMDLSSTSASILAPNHSPVNIFTGGKANSNGTIYGGTLLSIIPGQLLTPAQYLAVQETMRGAQTLQIGQYGQAIGGYTSVYSFGIRNQKLESIVVPQNVSMNMIGFGLAKPLDVLGDVSVLGHLYALQNMPNVSSAFRIGNLEVKAGASISGSLPSNFDLGRNAFASNGLNLTVLHDFTNMGSISTPGVLSVNAGGSISNQSSSNSLASLTAQNINLVSGSGQFFNSGLIQALNCINIDTAKSLTDLHFQSTARGTIQAINGAINLRGQAFAGTGASTMDGGNWLSKQLNFNSGSGALNASVEMLSGTVNANADSAHILANTPVFTIGDAKISGDPTYINAGGDIQIVGTVSENENLAIIASGNITASGAAQIINHGHDIWLVAGAKIDTSAGTCVTCNSGSTLALPPGSPGKVSSGLIQVSSTGSGGGNIDLSANNTIAAGQTLIDSSSTIAGNAGGKVTLVALANGSAGGKILLPSGGNISSINSSGLGSGANGDVFIAAGASTGQGVSIGSITSNGGSGKASNVTILAAQAAFSGGQGGCADCLSFDASGTVSGDVSSTTPTDSAISLNGQININNGTGGSVTVSAQTNKLDVAAPITTAGSSVQLNGGSITISQPIGSPSDSMSIVANKGDITVNASGLIAAKSLNMSALSGAIKNARTQVSDSLSLSAGNDIVVSNSGSINSLSASSWNDLTLTNNGDVTLGGDIYGTRKITLTLTGVGNRLSLNGSKIYTSPGGQIWITTDRLSVGNGWLQVENSPTSYSGSITISPFTPSTNINLGGGSGGLQLTLAELQRFQSREIHIGISNLPGSYQGEKGTINFYGNFDVSTLSTSTLEIKLGGINNFGNITLYSKQTLDIDSDDKVLNAGKISTISGPSIIILRGSVINLNGDIDSNGGLVDLRGGILNQSIGTSIKAETLSATSYADISLVGAAHIVYAHTGASFKVINSLSLEQFSTTVPTNKGITLIDTNPGGIHITEALNSMGSIVLQTIGATSGPIIIDSKIDVTYNNAKGNSISISSDNAAMSINAPIVANGKITIDGGSKGSINGAGSISSSELIIKSGSGDINLSNLSSQLVSFNTTGNTTLLGSSSNLETKGTSNSSNISLSAASIIIGQSSSVTASSNLSLSTSTGSNGNITVGGTVTGASVSLTADGSGSLTQMGTAGPLISGSKVTLISSTGTIGALSTSTTNLTIGTTANVSIINIASDDLGITISGGKPLSIEISTNNGLNLSAPINASGQINLKATDIKLSGYSGTLISTPSTVSLSATNNITATGSNVIDAKSGLSFSPSGYFSVSPSSTVQNTSGVTWIFGNQITIASSGKILGTSILIQGQTANGSVAAGKNLLVDNSGLIQSSQGSLTVQSAAGQDIKIVGTGSGVFSSPSAASITAMGGSRLPYVVLGPGNMSFQLGSGAAPGAALSISTPYSATTGSTVSMDANTTYDFPNDYSNISIATNSFLGNPSQFSVKTSAHPNQNSTFSIYAVEGSGTIANSNGNVDLSQISLLSFPGTNIAIIASASIINSGNSLSIDLSSTKGSGGNLLLVAGFNFSPNTNGVAVGPLSRPYTLISNSATGGSIDLGNVSIVTSGLSKGGSITAIASSGSSASGSLSIGSISSKSTNGAAGNITIVANGITLGKVDASANQVSNFGNIVLNSVTGVSLSNPGTMQISNGVLSGGSFVTGSVGGNVSGGLLTANTITVSAGSILGLSTAINGSISASAGSINIFNTGNLASLKIASATGTVAIKNNGDLTLASNIIGPAGVSIEMGAGNLLTNNEFQIKSTDAPISLILDSYSLSGQNPIDAGMGAVTILPATNNRSIYISDQQNKGLVLSPLQLGNITAGSVTIGSSKSTGGIFFQSDLDASGKFDLLFVQGADGNFSSNNHTISMGSHSLNLMIGGEATLGSIMTTGSSLNISAAAVVVNGTVGSPSDDISITTVPGPFPDPYYLTVPLRKGISGTGLIIANNLTLDSAGAIGTGLVTRGDQSRTSQRMHVEFTELKTSVSGMLTAKSNGISFYYWPDGDYYIQAPPTICINNKSGQTKLSAYLFDSINNDKGLLAVSSTGDLVVENEIKADSIVLSTANNHSITLENGAKLITPTSSGTVIIVTDDLIINGLNPDETRISGSSVNIAPSNASTPINVCGGTGGLNLSELELLSMAGHTPTIGNFDTSFREGEGVIFYSAKSFGGINLNGALKAPLISFAQSGDGNFNQNGFPLIITNILLENGKATVGASGSNIGVVLAGSIEVSGPLVVGALISNNGNISGTGLVTAQPYGLTLSSKSGSIGPLNTASTGILYLYAKDGNINVSNVGNVFFTGYAETGSITLINAGNIELQDIAQLGYHHLVVSSCAIYAKEGINISQNAGDSFQPGYNRIITDNTPITLNVNFALPTFEGNADPNYAYIEAGSSTVTLAPPSNNFPINIFGGSGGMVFSNLTMQYIHAGNLILGSNSSGGGVNVYGSYDFSNLYNIQFLQGPNGGFNASGQTLTMGSKQLTIDVGGAATIGSILTTGTSLSIAAQSVNISGSVGSPADILAIRATAGSLDGSGQLIAGNALFSATGGGINITLNDILLDLPSNGGTVSYMTSPFAYLPPTSNSTMAASLHNISTVTDINTKSVNLSSFLTQFDLVSKIQLGSGQQISTAMNTINVNSTNIAQVKEDIAGALEDEHHSPIKRVNLPIRCVSYSNQSSYPRIAYPSAIPNKELARVYSDAPQNITGTAESFRITNSEALISATTAVSINTSAAQILLMKGALASIRDEEGVTFIRSCSHAGSVRVQVGKDIFSLNSGEELIVSKNIFDLKTSIFSDRLARRNTRFHRSGNSYLSISDFSIVSLMTTSNHLSHFRKSNDNADKRILARLLKTAATIDVVLKNRGMYSSHN